MALTAAALTCGDGVKFPGGTGCNVFAYATVGTDARWRGPKFSIYFQFKLTNTLFTAGACYAGCSVANGQAARRFGLIVTVDGADLKLQGRINSTACGAILTTFHTVAKDTTEHSVAWTYDQAGTYTAYWDGAVVDSGAVPCSDIADPAASDDIFTIHGNGLFDGSDLFWIDRVMFSDDVASSAQIADIHASCAAF